MRNENENFEKFCIKKFTIDLLKENIDVNYILNEDTKLPKKLKDLNKIEISFAAKLNEFNSYSNNNKFNSDDEQDINDFQNKNNFSYYNKDLEKKIPDEVIPVEEDKRFIYSYLPTKVNYNFPFLVNSNFILDAGRSQLKDHDLYKFLISLIPSYITKFYNDIKDSYGNSYANILFTDHKIDNIKFKDVFNTNLEKEFALEKERGITVFSNNISIRNKINKIYFDDFCISLKLDDHDFKSIKDFFVNLYSSNYSDTKMRDTILIKEEEEYENHVSNTNTNKLEKLKNFTDKQNKQDKGENLIRMFTSEKYIIDLIDKNKITKKDKYYIDKIKNHFNNSYTVFDDSILYEFINTSFYSDDYTNHTAYKLVKLLKNNITILNRIKQKNVNIFKDKNGNLSSVNKLFFYNLKNQDDYCVDVEEDFINEHENKNKIVNNLAQISLSDQKRINQEKRSEKKGNFGARNLIEDELLELFLIENNIFILQKLGLKKFSDNCELDEILKQLDSDYDKKTLISL